MASPPESPDPSPPPEPGAERETRPAPGPAPAIAPKTPFDVTKFACYLVAAIMGMYALDLLIGLLVCGYVNITREANTCNGERLGELLATLLATVVAFAGGLLRTPTKP